MDPSNQNNPSEAFPPLSVEFVQDVPFDSRYSFTRDQIPEQMHGRLQFQLRPHDIQLPAPFPPTQHYALQPTDTISPHPVSFSSFLGPNSSQSFNPFSASAPASSFLSDRHSHPALTYPSDLQSLSSSSPGLLSMARPWPLASLPHWEVVLYDPDRNHVVLYDRRRNKLEVFQGPSSSVRSFGLTPRARSSFGSAQPVHHGAHTPRTNSSRLYESNTTTARTPSSFKRKKKSDVKQSSSASVRPRGPTPLFLPPIPPPIHVSSAANDSSVHSASSSSSSPSFSTSNSSSVRVSKRSRQLTSLKFQEPLSVTAEAAEASSAAHRAQEETDRDGTLEFGPELDKDNDVDMDDARSDGTQASDTTDATEPERIPMRMCPLCRQPVYEAFIQNRRVPDLHPEYFKLLALTQYADQHGITFDSRPPLPAPPDVSLTPPIALPVYPPLPAVSPHSSPTPSGIDRSEIPITSSSTPAEATSSATPVILPEHATLSSYSEHLSSLAFNNGYYARFFKEERKIGHGTYGGVFLTHHGLDDVILGTYAVKKVPVGDSRPWLMTVLKEVRALERVRHPNVVGYKHTWLEYFRPTEFGPEVPCLFILMEYASHGSLAEHIWPKPSQPANLSSSHASRKLTARERARAILEQANHSSASADPQMAPTGAPSSAHFMGDAEVLKFFVDTCFGLRHLHRAGIIHRDLKPENLLLTLDYTDDDLRLLISDFGQSRIKGAPSSSTGNTGTLQYCAPECLLPPSAPGASVFASSSPLAVDGYDEKCDVWSLGVVLYAMCYGCLPFNADTPIAMLNLVSSSSSLCLPDFPPRSAVVKQLIREILVVDPRKRPSVDQILVQLRNSQEHHALQSRGGSSHDSFFSPQPSFSLPHTSSSSFVAPPAVTAASLESSPASTPSLPPRSPILRDSQLEFSQSSQYTMTTASLSASSSVTGNSLDKPVLNAHSTSKPASTALRSQPHVGSSSSPVISSVVGPSTPIASTSSESAHLSFSHIPLLLPAPTSAVSHKTVDSTCQTVSVSRQGDARLTSFSSSSDLSTSVRSPRSPKLQPGRHTLPLLMSSSSSSFSASASSSAIDFPMHDRRRRNSHQTMDEDSPRQRELFVSESVSTVVTATSSPPLPYSPGSLKHSLHSPHHLPLSPSQDFSFSRSSLRIRLALHAAALLLKVFMPLSLCESLHAYPSTSFLFFSVAMSLATIYSMFMPPSAQALHSLSSITPPSLQKGLNLESPLLLPRSSPPVDIVSAEPEEYSLALVSRPNKKLLSEAGPLSSDPTSVKVLADAGALSTSKSTLFSHFSRRHLSLLLSIVSFTLTLFYLIPIGLFVTLPLWALMLLGLVASDPAFASSPTSSPSIALCRAGPSASSSATSLSSNSLPLLLAVLLALVILCLELAAFFVPVTAPAPPSKSKIL